MGSPNKEAIMIKEDDEDSFENSQSLAKHLKNLFCINRTSCHLLAFCVVYIAFQIHHACEIFNSTE